MDEAREQLNRLAHLGIDLEIITQQLQDDGVTKFADAFNGLIEGIAEKRRRLQEVDKDKAPEATYSNNIVCRGDDHKC